MSHEAEAAASSVTLSPFPQVPGVGVFVLLATAVGGPGGVWALWGGEEGMCGRHRSFPDLQSDVYITG